jgi:uncharacterized protein
MFTKPGTRIKLEKRNKHMRSIITLLFLLIATAGFSQKDHTSVKSKQVKSLDQEEMKTYYLVFLKKGLKRDQDSATAAEIQKGHMTHLTKMYNEGKMDLAGPIMQDGEIKGICVYNVPSLEEAKKLAESDPAVTSGRLVVEILPWYSQKGAKLR